MDFVNAERAGLELARGTRLHPFAIAPLVAIEIVNHRGSFFSVLAEESERIGFQQQRTARRSDLELVVGAFADAGQEQFPDPAPEQSPHRIDPAIPAVEVADDADALRVRRPDREVNALRAAKVAQVRAEFFVELQMVSLGKQMQVHLAHDEPVAVGIMNERARSIPAAEMNAIIRVSLHPGERGLEKSLGAEAIRGEALFFSLRQNDAHFLRVGPEDAHDEIVADPVRPEDPKRIGMRAGEEEVELVHGHTGYFERAHARR